MADYWRCGDCGWKPVGSGRPTVLTCPGCVGDYTWEPIPDDDASLLDQKEQSTDAS